MNQLPDEFKDTFISEVEKGKTLKQIAGELGISEGTLRNWKKRYFPYNSYKAKAFELKNRKDKRVFKNTFLRIGASLSDFEKTTGHTRQTIAKWKRKYFPEIGSKKELYIKLREKKELSINELIYLLRIHRVSVLRFKREYEAGKMREFEKKTSKKGDHCSPDQLHLFE